MTHKMVNIALYQPDIPQNTAAIVRLGACFKLNIHIIGPCAFNLEDKRFKRVAMDYANFTKIYKYKDYNNFKMKNSKSRFILITTKAKKYYHNFKFMDKDMLIFGKESAGVPKNIHAEIKDKLKIPMQSNTRSLNIAISVAVVISEALRQNNFNSL